MNRNEVVDEFEKQIQSSYRIKKRIENSVGAINVSRQKLSTLISLRLAGKSKLKDIAEDTGSSPQSLCIMFNNLEKEGLIKREIDSNDRRNTYYSVSEKGDKMLKIVMVSVKKAILKVLDGMNDKDVEEFGKALKTINKIVEENF